MDGGVPPDMAQVNNSGDVTRRKESPGSNSSSGSSSSRSSSSQNGKSGSHRRQHSQPQGQHSPGASHRDRSVSMNMNAPPSKKHRASDDENEQASPSQRHKNQASAAAGEDEQERTVRGRNGDAAAGDAAVGANGEEEDDSGSSTGGSPAAKPHGFSLGGAPDSSGISEESFMSWLMDQKNRGVGAGQMLDVLGLGVSDGVAVDDDELWEAMFSMGIRLIQPTIPARQKLDHVNTLQDVAELLRSSKKIVVLAGAGISVSCGIPDFRSENGIYSNIDMLEHAAGISHERSVLCHGSFATATCLSCKKTYPNDAIREDVLSQRVPMCSACNAEDGIVKPDIVFFGESLPRRFHDSIKSDENEADLVLVMGSSLKVNPVRSIVGRIRKHTPMVLINRLLDWDIPLPDPVLLDQSNLPESVIASMSSMSTSGKEPLQHQFIPPSRHMFNGAIAHSISSSDEEDGSSSSSEPDEYGENGSAMIMEDADLANEEKVSRRWSDDVDEDHDHLMGSGNELLRNSSFEDMSNRE
ncbi:Nad-dependent histone deacetylase sir2-like protein, partial [Globisporangium splendens]